MADRYQLQSGTGIIELQSSTDDLLLQSDGVVASDPTIRTALPEAPRPISRTVAVQAQSWVSRGFLGLLNDFTKVFRTPLFTPRFVRTQPQYQFATNLLLTTLAVTAVAPFTPACATQLDPVRSKVSVQQSHQSPNLLLSTLSVPVGKTSNGAIPGIRVQAQQPVNIGNLLENTLAPIEVGAPFTLTDWQNPVRVVSPREYGSTQAQVFNTPDPVVNDPFKQVEWPNPALNPRQTQGLVASQIFNTADVAQVKPFLQTDWQNPVWRVPIREYGFVQAQVFNTADVVNIKPFLLTDWQNPILRVRQVVPISHRPTVDPATPQPETGTPFIQTDWQNPVRAVAVREYGSIQAQVFNTADVVIVKPFLQADWQNPRINPKYRQFLNSGRVLGEEPLPFAQTEWPNPLLKPLARQGLTVAQIFNTADVVFVKPFLQLDWPNPVLPVPLPHSGFERPLPYEVFIIVPPPVTTTRNRVFGMGRGYSNT